jgi:phosphoglycolate phosphatase
MKKLVLFDIDGTLIDSGQAGQRAWNRVFWSEFAIPDGFQSIRMDGKTDIQILKEGLKAHRLQPAQVLIGSITSRYLEILKSEIQNPRAHVLAGVRELLAQLADDENYGVGLLTGNLEAGAWIKLSPFGLDRYFAFGAFGSDHEDRTKLLPIVVDKFVQKTGNRIGFGSCIVVGDTPRDVACAKPYGAQTIAVATGIYTIEDLLKTGADHVLNNLREAPAIFRSFITPGATDNSDFAVRSIRNDGCTR